MCLPLGGERKSLSVLPRWLCWIKLLSESSITSCLWSLPFCFLRIIGLSNLSLRTFSSCCSWMRMSFWDDWTLMILSRASRPGVSFVLKWICFGEQLLSISLYLLGVMRVSYELIANLLTYIRPVFKVSKLFVVSVCNIFESAKPSLFFSFWA